jgi:hypothetical protein
MKQIIPYLYNNNSKTNRQKKILKNSKIKNNYFAPQDISSYIRTFSNNNFRKNYSYFMQSM